jgi:CRISPR-associated protein Csm1
MDETTIKIAASGLFHDIGKIVELEALDLPADYVERNADLYQPSRDGYHTHRHSLLSAAFIERYSALLPPELNMAQWGQGDSFINLAAMHHKPETPLQWIITVADRLSSGLDRHGLDDEAIPTAPKDYRQTRLWPVFEELQLPADDGQRRPVDRKYRYPLLPLSTRSIFPSLGDAVHKEEHSSGKDPYGFLFTNFVKDLGALLHRRENLEIWFEHFDSLLMVYTALVPSARAGNVVPDVSLYDHSRTTAALAAALYLYHRDTNSMNEEAIRRYDESKFLLIMGDFYGIQDFIFRGYGDTRKLRSKLLRGRSFSVSLFSEFAADLLCRKIGLPFLSVVLQAAGKFTVIAPNTPACVAAVRAAEKEINEWLVRISYGENSIGLSFRACGPKDFTKENFRDLWQASQADMECQKLNRIDLNQYGGSVDNYLNSFNNDLTRPLCPLCGKRPSDAAVEGLELIGDVTSACKPCRDHVFLGTNLMKKDRLAVLTADADSKDQQKSLLEPIYEKYQVSFTTGNMNEPAREGRLLRYWNLSLSDDGGVPTDITARLINGYIPTYDLEDQYDDRILAGEKSETKKLLAIDQIQPGVPKTLEHIACKALNPSDDGESFAGVAALGVLKADVDELGTLLSYGLPKQSFTLSRLATLSRQLDFFFSLHLPHLLKTNSQYRDIYTVFAGGDDLFVIGPWNKTLSLVRRLKDDFANYVCRNPHVHFSAGIGLHKAHTPLEQMAHSAEEALERSKEAQRNRLTVFGQTVTHDEHDRLGEIKADLLRWLEDEWVTNAMLYRLNGLIDMAGLEQRLLSRGRPFRLADMECTKWRAYLAYSAERNLAKRLSGDDREAVVREMSLAIAEWLTKFGSKVKIPLWEVLYDRR